MQRVVGVSRLLKYKVIFAPPSDLMTLSTDAFSLTSCGGLVN
jgi:hypothetical protein